jgi:hypothetical protein
MTHRFYIRIEFLLALQRNFCGVDTNVSERVSTTKRKARRRICNLLEKKAFCHDYANTIYCVSKCLTSSQKKDESERSEKKLTVIEKAYQEIYVSIGMHIEPTLNEESLAEFCHFTASFVSNATIRSEQKKCKICLPAKKQTQLTNFLSSTRN